ncbi:MAG: hypothetical protein ACU841_01275 [Gammaproteobacteria bacterium]
MSTKLPTHGVFASILAAMLAAVGADIVADSKNTDLAVSASIADHCVITTTEDSGDASVSTCTDGRSATLDRQERAGATDPATPKETRRSIGVETVLY